VSPVIHYISSKWLFDDYNQFAGCVGQWAVAKLIHI